MLDFVRVTKTCVGQLCISCKRALVNFWMTANVRLCHGY
jgi:hypothetical protein